MKSIIYVLIIFLIIPYCISESSSLNWASKKYVDNNFCKEGGNCSINYLNVSIMDVTNTTITNINLTGDFDNRPYNIYTNTLYGDWNGSSQYLKKSTDSAEQGSTHTFYNINTSHIFSDEISSNISNYNTQASAKGKQVFFTSYKQNSGNVGESAGIYYRNIINLSGANPSSANIYGIKYEQDIDLGMIYNGGFTFPYYYGIYEGTNYDLNGYLGSAATIYGRYIYSRYTGTAGYQYAFSLNPYMIDSDIINYNSAGSGSFTGMRINLDATSSKLSALQGQSMSLSASYSNLSSVTGSYIIFSGISSGEVSGDITGHYVQFYNNRNASAIYGAYLDVYQPINIKRNSTGLYIRASPEYLTNQKGRALYVEEGDTYLKNTLIPANYNLSFGNNINNADAYIYWDGTNLRINANNTNPNGLVYVEGNVSAKGFNTRTQVNMDEDVLEKSKLGTELLNPDGTINHAAFGECHRTIEVENKSDCIQRIRKVLYHYNITETDNKGETSVRTYSAEYIESIPENVNYTEEYLYESVCSKTVEDQVDVTCEVAKQKQIAGLLNRNVDLLENITVFHTGTLAEQYITNTTKDPATLTKVENFYNSLKDRTYQDMKSLVLTEDGKLSDSVLFDYELSKYGSYDIAAIAHTSRAMSVLMMWKIAQLEKQQEEEQACWNLATQQEIINCMRNID